MKSESTKSQIRAWLEHAIKNRNNPHDKEVIRRKRNEKRIKVAKFFGF